MWGVTLLCGCGSKAAIVVSTSTVNVATSAGAETFSCGPFAQGSIHGTLHVRGMSCADARTKLRAYIATERTPTDLTCSADAIACWRGGPAFRRAPFGFELASDSQGRTCAFAGDAVELHEVTCSFARSLLSRYFDGSRGSYDGHEYYLGGRGEIWDCVGTKYEVGNCGTTGVALNGDSSGRRRGFFWRP